ncbi:MAG: LTA synthase family protein [Bacteroidetes bacterium]|nr:LTA synthase family protein [Bacteroidota bacterium]
MTRQGFAQKKTVVTPQPAPALVQLTDAALTNTIPDPVTPPLPHEENKESVWIVQRTIIPAIIRAATFFTRSFRYYINHALVLLLLLLVARGYELVYELIKHGTPDLFGKVVLMGLAKDMVFFLQIGAFFYPVFALCYLLHKKLAQIVFIVLSVMLLLIQLLLSEYFITTLVPLGADLWGYSIADIRQTVGASGGVKPAMILLLLAMLSLLSTAFIYLPQRLKLRGLPLFVFFLAFILVLTTDGSKEITKWLPGKEHSNNISLNKSQHFFQASYEHFFPQAPEEDIYSDRYSGDYAISSADAKQFGYNYVDEKNYPFLHSIDSSKDVLSPYFIPAETPPNIVILLVEGLGRAFTNKGAYLGNFTPFIDSLSQHSLYWENMLSEGGRTFAALPSVLSSMPFARNGFSELGEEMPPHLSLLNLLKHNGYKTSFYYGGDSHFDNMDIFLKKNAIDELNDEKNFPQGYTKMPAQNGFSWGYGDKELFRRFLNTQKVTGQPYFSLVLTVSTHSPFQINEQERYLARVENRMIELGMSETQKKESRRYNKQYASILYTDDAVRDFMDQYKRRPDFANTVFFITGDHRMPEIPMSTKIDRYHVPLLVYSPRLARVAKISSVSTHFDIAPSLLAWLKKSYHLQLPDTVAWMGSGLDTVRQFRNIHAYPIMQTKTDLIDFVMGDHLLNGNDLYTISSNMDLEPDGNEAKKNELRAAFNRFKEKNERFLKSRKVVPDSLLRKYLPR